jgi:DNA replicative helicase MCM subunit Mcm2 (Cdc46/Mcm family)
MSFCGICINIHSLEVGTIYGHEFKDFTKEEIGAVKSFYSRSEEESMQIREISEDENIIEVYIGFITKPNEHIRMIANAIRNNGKYEFECIDNIGNKIKGYFYEYSNGNMVVLLNCMQYSKEGKKMKKYYNNKEQILEKYSIPAY